MASLLQSTLNTRQVLPGSFRYLRSDAPIAPTDADAAFLLAHSVTLLIDLRSEAEVLCSPCPLAVHPGFIYRHMPVTGGDAMPDSPADVPLSYLRMADGQMERILAAITGAAANVMFFCTAGKDRTGVVAALLQRRSGMSREEIAADYARSGENLQERFAAFRAQHPEIDTEIYTPKAAYMERFLALLEASKREQR